MTLTAHGDSIDTRKAAVREEMKRLRQNLSNAELEEKSRLIADRLFALEEFQWKQHVLWYLSRDMEVQTDEMIARSMGDGKNAYVPVLDRKNEQLGISHLQGMDIDFDRGAFGVRQPAKPHLNFVAPSVIDIVILPGLAFDLKGSRVGYGLGYYDILLKQLSEETICVAVGFDFQILESIPTNEFDMPVHMVVTDQRTVFC